jgi:hypothetical protein
MRNASYPDIPPREPDWSPTNDNIAARRSGTRSFGLFQWWYRLTTPIEPPAHASFIWRESYRQARLFSNVALFLIAALVLAVPVCLFLANPYLLSVDFVELIITCVCLLLNRIGLTLIAGIVQVVSFEFSLTIAILIMLPLDTGSIQIVDLFVVGIMLAVSLLPTRYVFLVALYNSLFIWFNINHQSPPLDMILGLHSQFISLIAHTVGLQFMVAGISSIWVYNTTKAIRHADKTALVTKLEYKLVEQRKELESGIEQILQTHVSVANGNLNTRVPLAQNHVLWQVARVLNSLLVRFQRASMAERELHHVELAITSTVGVIQKSAQQRQQVRIPFTQTAIDPLIAAMQGRSFAFTRPLRQHNNSLSTDPINTSTLNTQFSSRHTPP